MSYIVDCHIHLWLAAGQSPCHPLRIILKDFCTIIVISFDQNT